MTPATHRLTIGLPPASHYANGTVEIFSGIMTYGLLYHFNIDYLLSRVLLFIIGTQV